MPKSLKEIKQNINKGVSLILSSEYKTLLKKLKDKIRDSRLKAALAVNQEVISLYWHIGKQIIERKSWGNKFIETLSKNLRNAFPETSGFSVRNLQRMQQFAAYYPELKIMPQAVAQLPWGHVSVLIHKFKDETIRHWYAKQTIEQGWSRPTLERYVKDSLYQKQAVSSRKTSNYLTHLPSPQSVLAQELLKQPYEAHEREIEHASIHHITKFMLELGKGFAFVGSQVPITIRRRILHRYVVL